MENNSAKGSEDSPLDESSSKKEFRTDYTPPANFGNGNNQYDDGEQLEIDVFRIIRIKSKRVTGKVIIVIAIVIVFVILTILLAWLTKR
jgi:hypothetical protein